MRLTSCNRKWQHAPFTSPRRLLKYTISNTNSLFATRAPSSSSRSILNCAVISCTLRLTRPENPCLRPHVPVISPKRLDKPHVLENLSVNDVNLKNIVSAGRNADKIDYQYPFFLFCLQLSRSLLHLRKCIFCNDVKNTLNCLMEGLGTEVVCELQATDGTRWRWTKLSSLNALQ